MKALFKRMAQVRDVAIDLIFPKRCIECGCFGGQVCASCLDKIKILKNTECPVCRKESFDGWACDECRQNSHLDFLHVVADYDSGVIDNIIRSLKYNYLTDLADAAGVLIRRYFKERRFSGCLLVPVPLHRKRLLERGFNQAALIAEQAAHALGGAVENSLLLRVKYSLSQAKLSAKERRENLDGYFDVDVDRAAYIDRGRQIILVDDVLTTGSTMQECAKMLKIYGFKNVGGLVLARGRWT